MRTLRRARPDTPILLVEDRSYTNAFNPGLRDANLKNRAALKAAFEALKAEGVANLFYLEGEPQLGDDREGTVDGSHPNDLGFQRMADVFTPAVQAAIGGATAR